MHAPNKLTIDLSALVYNYLQIKTLIGNETPVMGVVKADAYGHGLLPVARALEKQHMDFLGVAFLHEALLLRKSHIQTPIVILTGVQTQEEARIVVEKDMIPVLYDITTAEHLSREGERQGKIVPVHIKVDTGMGRLGIMHTEIRPFIQRISELKGLVIEALTSHLSSADDCEGEFTNTQVERFKGTVETVRAMGVPLPLNSLANSAGLMGRKDACFELVRPGISLYGGRPCPDFALPVQLKPVMHFKGRVLQIRDLPADTPVSYGRMFYTGGPCKIAVLSAGYADGLLRSMSNAGVVLIRGMKAPLVGTICMNMSVADVTAIPDAIPGDEAVFLGSQGERTITGDDMARSAGTISYEVFCALGQGNEKEYVA